MCYYGFLSPSASLPLEEVKARIELAYGFTLTTPDTEVTPPAVLRCPLWGGALVYQYSVIPRRGRTPFVTPLGAQAMFSG